MMCFYTFAVWSLFISPCSGGRSDKLMKVGFSGFLQVDDVWQNLSSNKTGLDQDEPAVVAEAAKPKPALSLGLPMKALSRSVGYRPQEDERYQDSPRAGPVHVWPADAFSLGGEGAAINGSFIKDRVLAHIVTAGELVAAKHVVLLSAGGQFNQRFSQYCDKQAIPIVTDIDDGALRNLDRYVTEFTRIPEVRAISVDNSDLLSQMAKHGLGDSVSGMLANKVLCTCDTPDRVKGKTCGGFPATPGGYRAFFEGVYHVLKTPNGENADESDCPWSFAMFDWPTAGKAGAVTNIWEAAMSQALKEREENGMNLQLALMQTERGEDEARLIVLKGFGF